jgi:hypothetical protein
LHQEGLVNSHRRAADETEDSVGSDRRSDPYDLLLPSFGVCTSILEVDIAFGCDAYLLGELRVRPRSFPLANSGYA